MNELIEKARHIIILTHMAPDGDAMGSALAMWHHIAAGAADRCAAGSSQSDCKTAEAARPQAEPAAREVTVIVPNAFPAFFNWMPGADQIKVYEKEMAVCNQLIEAADLFICTDFNDPKRIGPVGEKMLTNPAPKVMIDHHLREGQGAPSGQYKSTNEIWTEIHSYPAASSACEVVYKLIAEEAADRCAVGPSQSDCKTADAVGSLPLLDKDTATCIYTGLMTDTGNFSYNSTNPELYDIIASLLRAGVEKDAIYNAVFNQYSIDRLRMTGFALYRKMRIYPEHHLALITLSADELDQYHYQVGDTEGIVNMPLQIADVYYSVMMREERPKPGTPKPRIRISFRSQGDRPVNVWANEVFHGGGHANASGGELFGSMAQAVALFEKTYRKYVRIDN